MNETENTTEQVENDKYSELENNLYQKRKKLTRRKIILTVFLILLLLALASAAIYFCVRLYRKSNTFSLEKYVDAANIDSPITRVVGSANAKLGFSSRKETYAHGLAVASVDSVRYLTPNGKKGFVFDAAFSSPALVVNGDYFVAYDANGNTLYLFDEGGLHAQTTTDGNIIAVSLNPDGTLCLICESQNCISEIAIYSSNLEILFKWFNTDYYISSASYSSKSKICLACATELKEYDLNGVLLTIDITQAGIRSRQSLNNTVPLLSGTYGQNFSVLTDSGVYYLDDQGKIIKEIPIDEEPVFYCSDDSGRFYFYSQSNDGSIRLQSVSPSGTEIRYPDAYQKANVLVCNSTYLALMLENTVLVYNKDMDVIRTIDISCETKDIAVLNDGSVVLFSQSEIRIV